RLVDGAHSALAKFANDRPIGDRRRFFDFLDLCAVFLPLGGAHQLLFDHEVDEISVASRFANLLDLVVRRQPRVGKQTKDDVSAGREGGAQGRTLSGSTGVGPAVRGVYRCVYTTWTADRRFGRIKDSSNSGPIGRRRHPVQRAKFADRVFWHPWENPDFRA